MPRKQRNFKKRDMFRESPKETLDGGLTQLHQRREGKKGLSHRKKNRKEVGKKGEGKMSRGAHKTPSSAALEKSKAGKKKDNAFDTEQKTKRGSRN